MAKVIRKQWVWKKQGHSYKYLPRRNDGLKEYDFIANESGPENFPEKLNCAPPKLWLGWLYRGPNGEPKWTKKVVKNLFGEDYEVGKMEIFKNTASVNEQLWRIKHLIELKPLTFPNGEPTIDDIKALEVLPDGRCIINKATACDDKFITVFDAHKQWSAREISGRLKTRVNHRKDVFEDTVYNPANMSIID